ncbi:single-stranded-DNA-specific exonuclease RecJ [Rhodovibrionaceae bacterium A322]
MTSTAERACFLNVEQSLTGKRWEERGGDSRLALAMSQRLHLPEVIGRILAARNITLEEAPSFLEPTLRSYLPNPSRLQDMDKAAARVARAVMTGEKIAVFGDYDVDGATSSALLKQVLEAAGGQVRIYIPDRMTEGYGPNTAALLRLKEEGAGVILTVDCGISAFDPLSDAAKAGVDVVVVDHHAAEPRLPEAHALVNPNRLDDDSGLGQLAAVGVAFLLAVAVNRTLREANWFKTSDRQEPSLLGWLDLVALGTVCDVVPLTGLNRAFVTQGLKVMSKRNNIGLSALADVSRMDSAPGTYHAGFLLGPRVNAGGRVGEASLGARLLTTGNRQEAQDIAQQLDGYNIERKEIEASVLDQAILQVEEEGAAPEGLVFAAGLGWHPGVIGIVASRLKDRYNLPSLVMALEEDASGAVIGKGSGRSVPGVDLGAAVTAARQADLLINGGGHPMAAGVTVAGETLPQLRAFLTERLAHELARIAYRPALGFDGVLSVSGAKGSFFKQLQKVGPFGTGNPEPRFALSEARIAQASVVGQNHVRCQITDSTGGRLKAIAFRALDTPLGDALLNSRGLPLHLAGKLREDSWAGPDAVQFQIEDGAFAR